jgi:hypothetical protein
MIAVLSTPESMTAERYDRLTEEFEASGAGPAAGHRLHVCFGHGDHLLLFDLWDSVEELHASTTARADDHIAVASAEPLQVHRLVDDGDSDALRATITALREQAFFIRPA